MDWEQAKTEYSAYTLPVLLFDDTLTLQWYNEGAAPLAKVIDDRLGETLRARIRERLAQFGSAQLPLSDFPGLCDEVMFIKTSFGVTAMVDRSARIPLPSLSYALSGTDLLGAEVREDIEHLLLAAGVLEVRLESDEPEVEHGFEELRRGAYRVLRTMTNATLVSEFFGGGLALRPVRCDLALLTEELCHAARMVSMRRMNLTVKTPAQPVQAVVDVELYKRALLNLLLNAVQYEDEENEINVTLAQTGGRITVTVRDNGKGIRANNLPEVHRPYFSVDPADDGGARPGLGLGLTVAHIFCRMHGGSFLLDSEFGEGTGVAMMFEAGDADDAPELRETAAHYLTDHGSRLYVELCDICAMPR